MRQYRITKYDPKYRVNGAYTRDEWTSISDVGKTYDGRPFNMADYERAEQQHIDFLCSLAERDGAFPLTVRAYEQSGVFEQPSLEGCSISPAVLPDLLRRILREECWCCLESKDFFIHFGYEYYLYVGCSFTQEGIAALAADHALFAEHGGMRDGAGDVQMSQALVKRDGRMEIVDQSAGLLLEASAPEFHQ